MSLFPRRLESWQRTLAIIFLTQLFSSMAFSIVFPFLPLYVTELPSTLHLDPELLAGLVIASQAFTMMIIGPVWGTLADRYGRKLMVLRATFGGAITLVLMGAVISAEQLVLMRAMQGLITGTVAAANALVASEAPRERVGYAMGIVQVGQWSGVSLGPLLGGVLADAFGYRVPFYVTGVLLFAAGVLVLFGIREQFSPSPRIIEGHIGMFAEWRRVVHMQGVTVTYVARWLSSLGRNIITPITPLFVAALLVDSGTVSTATGLISGVSSAAATVGAIWLGRLGDRIGHRTILMWCALAGAVFYLPQAAVGDVWQLVILQGLFGLASGGMVSAPSALLAQYTPAGEEGSVYGLDNSVVASARTIAPLLGSGMALALGLRSTFILSGLVFVVMTAVVYGLLPRVNPALLAGAGGEAFPEPLPEPACADK